MSDLEKSDEGFETVSQTMRDISQTFESSRSNKADDATMQENIQAYAKYQDWLQTVQQMQSGFINATTEPARSPSQTEGDEDITTKIAALQEELLAESTKHGIKELIVRSAQLASRLQELLFPRQPPAEEEPEKTAWARDLCDRQRTVASDILAHHQACQSLQDEVDSRKAAIRDLQASNVELMTRLQNIESEEKTTDAPSRSLQRQQEKLEKLVSHIAMERGILQGLVIGSGVNWAKDEGLREVVIGLGKPLDLDR